MKINIISDGTSSGTKITDIATGKILGCVQKVVWELDINNVSKCTLEISGIPLDLTTEVTEVKHVKVDLEDDSFVKEVIKIKEEEEKKRKDSQNKKESNHE